MDYNGYCNYYPNYYYPPFSRTQVALAFTCLASAAQHAAQRNLDLQSRRCFQTALHNFVITARGVIRRR